MDRRKFLIGGTVATAGMATGAAYAQDFDSAWSKVPPERPLALADIESADVDVTANKIRDLAGGTGVLNLVDDFGGSVTAWIAYYTAQGTKQTLFIPPGTYDLSAANLVPGGPGAVIQAYGASCKIAHFFTGVIPGKLGGGLPMGRFESVSYGASQITLINPATYAQYYPPGTWCCLMGFDMQFYGYPPNNHFFEFQQIKDINFQTGLITFSSLLRNSYKSTWPLNSPGSWSTDDCGGPASIFPMSSSWNSDFILRGMNITNSKGGEELFGAVKNALFEDCTFNYNLPAPSAHKNCTFRRCTTKAGGTMEVDKAVERLEFDKCRDFFRILIQSTSVNQLIVRDSEINEILGVAQETIISGSIINHLGFGPDAYGVGRTLTIDNTHINNFEVQDRSFVPSDFTSLLNGILTLPRSSMYSSNAAITMVPGAAFYFAVGHANIGGTFRILDVWRDGVGGNGPNWIYKTTLADPIPIPSDADLVTMFGTSEKLIRPHPCGSISVTNSFGSSELEILSRAPKGLPIYSYYYSGLIHDDRNGLEGKLWGRIERLVIKVHRPYTGTQATMNLQVLNIYGGGIGHFIKRDLSIATLYPKVDAKIAGTRVIDAVNGIAKVEETDTDLLPFMDGLWIVDGMAPGLIPDISEEDPSKWPIIEVECWTDQGPEVAEPRHRW